MRVEPILLKQIVIWICEPCLNGDGEMCHVPGCALIRHKVDLPIESYVEIGWQEAEG